MSEFEEELNNLPVSIITNYGDYWNKAKLLTVFKDWHSPEHIEKEVEAKREKLPVVPAYVDEFINGDEKELSKADRISYLLKSVQGDSYYLTEELPRDETITLEEGSKLYNWSICQHHETILKLWGGYTVEKPKLFYLKNKLTGLNLVLEQCFNPFGNNVGERFREYNMQCIVADEQEARLYKNTFTQKEIDDLDTGGYERIEVEE